MADREVHMAVKKITPSGECGYVALWEAIGNLFLTVYRMRQICLEAINADRTTFNDAVLGESLDEYAPKLLHSGTYIGENEIKILARYFGLNVTVVSGGVLIPYHLPPHSSPKVVYLLYDRDRSHYDIACDAHTGSYTFEYCSVDQLAILDALAKSLDFTR